MRTCDSPLHARYPIILSYLLFPVQDTKSKVCTPSPHVCERKANYSLTSQNPVYTLNTLFAWSENSPPPVLTRSRAQHTSKNLIYVSLQKCGHKSPHLWTVIGQSGSRDSGCRALIGPRIRKCKYWIKLFDFPPLCPPRPCLLQVTTNKAWQYL